MKLQKETESDKRYLDFKYKTLISQKINSFCHFGSLAFNRNCTILFIGEISVGIKVIGFNNKQKIIQTIINETENFFFLLFLKKFNQLVSYKNSLIHLWCQDKNNFWKPQITLQEQESSLCGLIINKEENLLISASENKKIMFWKQANSSWKCYQTIDVQLRATCLSLNNQSTKLIIGCYNIDRIAVIENQSNQKWITAQIIKIEEYGQRLIFINSNQFLKISNLFLEFTDYGHLQIYNFDQETKLFIKNKQIQVQKCMECQLGIQCQLIEQKNIFLVNQGCCDTIFQIDQNGEFVLKQIIQYDHHCLNVSLLTENGEYLVACVSDQQAISVRKLKNLE